MALTNLDKKLGKIKDEAEAHFKAIYDDARIIISFSEGDCIVDVMRGLDGSERFVFYPNEED